jgi:hypothetical protein
MGSVDNIGNAGSGLSTPSGAVGRPGLLAAVRRMSNVPEGRLVAVRGPAGWVSALLDREQPVFGWNAHLLGAPVRIEAALAPPPAPGKISPFHRAARGRRS